VRVRVKIGLVVRFVSSCVCDLVIHSLFARARGFYSSFFFSELELVGDLAGDVLEADAGAADALKADAVQR